MALAREINRAPAIPLVREEQAINKVKKAVAHVVGAV